MTDTTISTTDTVARTLSGTDRLFITSTGKLKPSSGPAVTWSFSSPNSTGIVIDNSGLIQPTSGRAFDTSGTAATSATSFTLINRSGASIIGASDIMRMQKSIAGGSMTITNDGTMQALAGRGFNIQEYSGLANFTFTNTGTLQSTDDAIKLSSATAGLAYTGIVSITNSGIIKTIGSGSGQAFDLTDVNTTTGSVTITNNAAGVIEAADADAIRGAVNATINNYGTIQGKNFSVSSTGNDGVDFQSNAGGVVNNYQGGQIIGARHGIAGTKPVTVTNDGAITGQLGSGINLDTTSATTTTITNQVHGVITGNAAGSTDGDGIDIDGLAAITNSGTIQALGTWSGGLNEAITIGGGSITNNLGGLIYSDQRAITVDDSNLGNAFAATTITNHGTITGANGEAIKITDTFGDTITNDGTINGSIDVGGGNDTVTNAGTINGAIVLGTGNDTLHWNTLVGGSADGGTGTDLLDFNGTFGPSSGSASFTNFETISGTLTGTSGNDVLNFAALTMTGSLTINGGGGNDTIAGGAENDTIDGGAGASDTVTFGGSYASYSISRNGNTVTVTGTNGTDTITNVELFTFNGVTYSVGQVGNVAPALTGSHAVLAHGTEDVAYTVSAANLLVGFTDANNDALSVTGLSASSGTVTNNLDGTYTITQAANVNGAVTLNYTVTDNNGGSVAASIGYTIDTVNDAPTLTGVQAVLTHGTEDVAYVVSAANLRAGFTDVDGDALSVANLSASSGSVTDNLDGTFTITQATNFNGPVTLNYNITDGHGGSTPASLGYTIDAVNDDPALTGTQAVLAHGTEDVAYTVSAADLLTGFTDVDGDALSVANLSASSGSLTDNLDGTFTITQAANVNGPITLSYDVTDGHGGSIAASLGYTVNAVNDAPALTGAQAVLAHGSEDAAYTVSAADLLTGFTDVDGDTLSVANLSAGSGSVTDNLDGTFTITQAANVNGPVTLNYDVTDGHGGSIAASLGYTIDAVNDAPALTGSQAVLAHGTEDVAYTVSAADLLTGFTDVDGDALSVTNLFASSGSITDNLDGTYTITQAANINGPITLSYTASDGNGGGIAASLGYTIDAVNDAPALTGSQAVLAHGTEDVAYTVSATNLLTGFTDVDGDTLSVANLSASTGSVTDNLDGTFTITQAANVTGPITLSYDVTDGHGGNTAASLAYTIDAVNDAPALTGSQAVLTHGTEDVAYTVSATNLLTGFTDVDGDTLSVANLSASSGSVTDNLDGTFTITQAANVNGPITLSYDVSDGHGGSTAASLGYTIDGANDAPSLTGSQAVLAHGTEDVSYTVSAADLLTGFTDADGDALSVANLSASSGSVTDNLDGTFTIAQAANANGPITLSYNVSDGHGGSTAASLGYTIDAVNDAPALTGSQAVLAHGTEDVTYTVSAANLLAGFTDVDGDALSVASLSASSGSVTDNLDGTFTIAQAANINGPITLSYAVTDGHGGSTSASLGYTIDAVNDAPYAMAISNSSLAENSANGTLVGTLSTSDVDNSTGFTYSLLNNAGGRFAVNSTTGAITVANGSLLDFETAQQHVIDVQVTDAAGATYHQQLTINLTNVVENQTYNGTANADVFSANSDDNWTVNGKGGNDTITTLGGADVVTGGAGADIISTGSGNDLILIGKGAGFDSIDGGAGNDSILATADGTIIGLEALSGIETISSNGFAGVRIQGSTNNNLLDFSATNLIGIESITGGAGVDQITGSAGSDTIIGAAGADFLAGGGGADLFVYQHASDSGVGTKADHILDFISGIDKIDLTGVDANASIAGDQAFTFIGTADFTGLGQLRIGLDGGHVALLGNISGTLKPDFEIILDNNPTLSASDFFL